MAKEKSLFDYIQRVRALAGVKRYDLAIKMANEGMAKYGQNGWLLALITEMYYFNDQFDEAIEAAEECLGTDPDETNAMCFKALSLVEKGQAKKGQQVMEKALSIDPTNHVLRINYGTIFMELKRYEKAIEIYEELIKTESDNLLVMDNLAMSYWEDGRKEKAQELVKKIMALDPQDDYAHYIQGMLNLDASKSKEAIESFEHVVRIAPTSEIGVDVRKKRLPAAKFQKVMGLGVIAVLYLLALGVVATFNLPLNYAFGMTLFVMIGVFVFFRLRAESD